MNNGSPVHGTCISADPSGGADVAIYSAVGNVTVTGTKRLVVTDIIVSVEAASVFTIGADKTAAHTGSNLVLPGATAGAGTVEHHFSTPFECPAGKTVEVIGTATPTKVKLTGYLMDA